MKNSIEISDDCDRLLVHVIRFNLPGGIRLAATCGEAIRSGNSRYKIDCRVSLFFFLMKSAAAVVCQGGGTGVGIRVRMGMGVS